MPKVKDAANIPDGVITIHDLKRHIRSIYNIPSSIHFYLRAWTNPKHGSKKTTLNFKDNEYIIDLEDAHDGRSPLMIVLKWAESAEKRKLRQTQQKLKLRITRQKLKLEDRQGRTQKQEEIDKHVCSICTRAECDRMSCNPYARSVKLEEEQPMTHHLW